jgi:hypothetical protein
MLSPRVQQVLHHGMVLRQKSNFTLPYLLAILKIVGADKLNIK